MPLPERSIGSLFPAWYSNPTVATPAIMSVTAPPPNGTLRLSTKMPAASYSTTERTDCSRWFTTSCRSIDRPADLLGDFEQQTVLIRSMDVAALVESTDRSATFATSPQKVLGMPRTAPYADALPAHCCRLSPAGRVAANTVNMQRADVEQLQKGADTACKK